MFKNTLLLIICSPLLLACSSFQPQHVDNICHIFREQPHWYWDAEATQKKWGIPITVQMAIIHQESHFDGDARPPREHILWVIPWFRPTSAYGYSQAVDSTWKHYKRETGGGFFTSRDDFGDATDFIGWYANRAHRQLGISLDNTYALYLAYHEGLGGYARGTYRNKAWLEAVARKVAYIERRYREQFSVCRSSLKEKPWWHVW